MDDATHRAAIAERAARAGGAVARERFGTDLTVEEKSNKNDLVTAADRDAQAQVVATIREEFPDDAFLCEEEGRQLVGPESGEEDPRLVDSIPEQGAAWVVDPIDGTANYVRGIPTWATAVAATVAGEPVGAATYLPAAGDLYAAGPDSATRNGDAMTVSARTDPETFAVAAVGWWGGGERAEFADLCGAIVRRFGDLRRVGSFQATLAQVADGGLEAAVCTQPTNAWDTLSGVHLVRRAGGTVTDAWGEPWTRDSVGLVASNGQAHDALLQTARHAIES